MGIGSFSGLTSPVEKLPDPKIPEEKEEALSKNETKDSNDAAAAKLLAEILAREESREALAKSLLADLAGRLAADKEKLSKQDNERRDNEPDKYDFRGSVQKLVDSVIREEISSEEKINRLNGLFKKSDLFFVEYDKILKKHLSEGKEEEAARRAFKNIFGDVVYSVDDSSSKVEILGGYPQPQGARSGAYRGHKVHYNERGIGFMTREEAEKKTFRRQSSGRPGVSNPAARTKEVAK